MNTPSYPNQSPPGRLAASELRDDKESLLADAEWASPNTLSIEEQFERFALWLKVTDGGHQPC